MKRRNVPGFWNATGKGIIITGIVLGMKYIHSRGYIHQDLKPDNIMINEHGQALIGDFGACRPKNEDCTPVPEAGTVHYAAPELYDDRIRPTPTVDVFSFGLILYEILVGVPVFSPE
jgi:serine/threonine protein kinase